MTSDAAKTFERARPVLTALAYRMLGERASAEDVVQEAWIRWAGQDHAAVRAPLAWLKRVTVRLAIDALRALKARREVYVGPWLPEPILREPEETPEDAYMLAQECELALLWAMERLAPEERAAFILRTAFDAEYAEIAALLGKTETAARQIVSRASRRLGEAAPRYDAPKEERAAKLTRFARACAAEDRESILALLAPDALALTDGGGKVRSALRPLTNAAEIAQVFMAIAARRRGDPAPIVLLANGAPALVALDDSSSATVMTLTTDASGLIDWIYVMRNPEKLGPLVGAATTQSRAR